MERKIKACGYIRVSTTAQAESGESLSTQRASIEDFAKRQGYHLTEIYEDRGISGGSVRERHALLRCLEDGRNGKFSVIIVHRLSRFGRNARELLDNYNQLKQAGIGLRSISEGIDFSTKYGEAMLGLLAVIAQLERDIIRETMLENRIAKSRKGIPSVGNLPYARTLNKETGEWTLDEAKADLIRRAADEYLKGKPLKEVAKLVGMSRNNLRETLREKCGDTWTVTFEGEDPITYKIKSILSDDIIRQVRDRFKFNRCNNRTDVPYKYVLSGFIRCEKCGKTLIGQTQERPSGEVYKYYVHQTACTDAKKEFSSIALKPIERAVFETIFENFNDEPAFEKAIEESLPNPKMIDNVNKRIHNNQLQLNKVNRQLEKLVDIAMKQTLTRTTIQTREKELLERKTQLVGLLNADKSFLESLPDRKLMEEEAKLIRRQLLEQYSGKERLQEMTFDEKKQLLHWLFDGEDRYGKPYGIYVTKTDIGIDYFMYGKIVGVRTLKGDNINYVAHIDKELDNEYKNKNVVE